MAHQWLRALAALTEAEDLGSVPAPTSATHSSRYLAASSDIYTEFKIIFLKYGETLSQKKQTKPRKLLKISHDRKGSAWLLITSLSGPSLS